MQSFDNEDQYKQSNAIQSQQSKAMQRFIFGSTNMDIKKTSIYID